MVSWWRAALRRRQVVKASPTARVLLPAGLPPGEIHQKNGTAEKPVQPTNRWYFSGARLYSFVKYENLRMACVQTGFCHRRGWPVLCIAAGRRYQSRRNALFAIDHRVGWRGVRPDRRSMQVGAAGNQTRIGTVFERCHLVVRYVSPTVICLCAGTTNGCNGLCSVCSEWSELQALRPELLTGTLVSNYLSDAGGKKGLQRLQVMHACDRLLPTGLRLLRVLLVPDLTQHPAARKATGLVAGSKLCMIIARLLASPSARSAGPPHMAACMRAAPALSSTIITVAAQKKSAVVSCTANRKQSAPATLR